MAMGDNLGMASVTRLPLRDPRTSMVHPVAGSMTAGWSERVQSRATTNPLGSGAGALLRRNRPGSEGAKVSELAAGSRIKSPAPQAARVQNIGVDRIPLVKIE